MLYIGTCSYDASKPKHLQTNQFKKLGCNVRSLDITHKNPGIPAMRDELWNTDIIVVSGGNTLWGRDRWVKIGLDKLIKKAVAEMYDVTVDSVRTMVCIGKKRVRGTKSGMIVGKTSTYKKAIVTLAEGDSIDFYSNI